MKKIISLLLAFVLSFTVMISASADSVIVDFGDVAGEAGDVDVDTYITATDLIYLRKVLLGMVEVQSPKTANVNKDEAGTVDIIDLVRLKKLLADMEAAYFADGITTVRGSEADKNTWIYQVNSSKLLVREADIDLGGDNELVLTHTTDWHIIAMNDVDYADTQIATSYNQRKTAFTDGPKNAREAMKFGNFYGKTIITGDVTDFLSYGSFDCVNSVIGKSDVIVGLGNHEFRKVWYGSYIDTQDINERYANTQKNWKNNIFYHSEIVNDKVMLVYIYNSAGADTQKYYTEAFTAKDALGNEKTDTVDNFFAGDLAIAKKNGYKVLLFQHTPTSTGKEEDASIKAILENFNDSSTKVVTKNFYNLSGHADNDTDMDRKMYQLITENADLIKGIFNGHVHAHVYSEVKAKSTPESTEYDAVIPQYTNSLNAYGYGCVTKITVKY